MYLQSKVAHKLQARAQITAHPHTRRSNLIKPGKMSERTQLRQEHARSTNRATVGFTITASARGSVDLIIIEAEIILESRYRNSLYKENEEYWVEKYIVQHYVPINNWHRWAFFVNYTTYSSSLSYNSIGIEIRPADYITDEPVDI